MNNAGRMNVLQQQGQQELINEADWHAEYNKNIFKYVLVTWV
jgi:hypothetical protein